MRHPQLLSWFTPLALFLLVLLRYLASLTQVHTFDALSYVLDVDRKPLRELFHPHHVAYGPLGALALGVARLLGYNGEAAVPLQVVNAAAGASGVALFYVLLRRIAARGDVALAAALLLGASYAYWYYAVEVEVYTVAVLFLVACLGLLAQLLVRPSAGVWAALGLAQSLAVLFHQTNVLLCVPALVAWLVSGPRGWKGAAQLVAYAATLAVGVGMGYGAAALLGGLHSWAMFAAWATSYARTGWWGGALTASKWTNLAKGLADTV
ncbi:MAG: glycosyltransferase family 39 protein, partial [Chloroflexales bacterium]|nr:glycosyltransferase family 39 protein [Chloroflexales bacterium]